MNQETSTPPPTAEAGADSDSLAANALAAEARREAADAHPKTFREFWGRCVRASRILRRTRDHEDVTLARSDFRDALKDAWTAGVDSNPPKHPPSK